MKLLQNLLFSWDVEAGKRSNSAISDFLSTPLHGVKEYHISIIANSEDQAKHRLMKSEPF